MAKQGLFEITGSNGAVYRVEAADEAQAARMGDFIEQQIQAGNPDLKDVEIPDGGQRDEYVVPQNRVAPEGDNGKSFLDTGMGMALGGVAKGGLNLAAAPLALLTGDSAPIEATNQLVEALGTRKPKTPSDRIMEAGFSGLGGAMAFPGLGAAISRLGGGGRAVGGVLGEAPVLQGVSGATGNISGQIAAEKGADPTTQLIASLAGGMAPGTLQTAGRAASRGIVRGADSTQMRETIDTFREAGAGTPTVGQASQGPIANVTEALMSKFFPTSRIIQDKVRGQEEGIGRLLGEKADSLGPERYNSEMGKIILDQSRTTMKNARQIQDGLFEDFYRRMPKSTIVTTPRFGKELEEAVSHIPGAKNLSEVPFLNPDKADYDHILVALKKDIAANGGQGLPFEALKEVRSRVGKLLERATFDSDKDTAQLKRLYGALSEDMKDAAGAVGTPTRVAFDKANTAVAQYHSLLDTVKPVLDRKGGPEKVFTAALAGTKDGGTVIKSVYHMLHPEARKLLTAQIMRRAAGNTDDFDMFKFARTYEKMEPEAQEVIFGSLGKGYKKNMDAIVDTIAAINKQKDKYGLATNPKEGMFGAQGILGILMSAPVGVAIGTAAGNPGVGAAGSAALIGGTAAVSMLARNRAKWMTNPKVVEWLAETTKIPPAQIPIAINTLSQQGARENDPDMIELAEYLKSQQESN